MGFFFLCLNITTTSLGKGFLLGTTYGAYLYGTAEDIEMDIIEYENK